MVAAFPPSGNRRDGSHEGDPNDPPREVLPIVLEAVRRYDEFRKARALVPDDIPLRPTGAKPTRTPEELARLGADVFDRRVRRALRPEDDGKFVAVDVVTGEYEVDADDYAAVARLRARVPAADVWLARAGSPATCRKSGS